MKFSDIHSMTEDERIRIIGDRVMKLGQTVAFVTDAEAGKADRYIEKLKAGYPGIVVLGRFDGPIKDTVTVKVGPPAVNN